LGFLAAPLGLFPLDDEAARVYTVFHEQVEQFTKGRGSLAMRDIEAPEWCFQQVFAAIWEDLPAQVRLRGLTIEERLAGLTPEQRLDGLSPDQIAAALTLEARDELARKLRH
jgi:hypothetical protein